MPVPGVKRLVYIHQYFTYPEVAGGSRSWEFVKRLLDDGFEVTVLTSDSELNERAISCLKQELAHHGSRFQLDVLPVRYDNSFPFWRRAVAFLQFAVSAIWRLLRYPRVDLVFATSTPLTVAVPALTRNLLRGTPFVFEIRDLWPEVPRQLGALRNPLLYYPLYYLAHLAYHRARRVVALSPGMKEGVVAHGVSPDKVVVISNVSDIETFRVEPALGEAFLERHPELKGGPLVVYTGTFGFANGVSYMVRLAETSRRHGWPTRFLAVGRGKEFERVRELAAQLGVLDQNYFQWDPIPKKEMPALLSAAAVATSWVIPNPAMHLNSANKYFDALAAARAVAINYGGWQAELLAQHGAGVELDAHDLERAARQLQDLVSSPERLQAAQERAARLADEQFSLGLLYARLKRVINSSF